MGLKPSRLEYEFVYHCPHCGNEIYRPFREVQHVDKGVCFCGQVLLFDIIDKVKPRILYQQTQTQPQSNNAIMAEFEVAIASLMNIGFKRSKAKQLIRQAIDDGHYNGDMVQFVEYLILERV